MSASLRNRRIFMGLGILAAIIVGLWLVFGGNRYVSTKDAYIKLDMVSLSVKVGGPLSRVPVQRNQRVEAGQLLVEVDPKPFRIAVTKARANLQRVHNQILSQRADYQQVNSQLAQAKRDVAYYKRQLRRDEKLKKVSVSESKLDAAQQHLHQAIAKQKALKAQLQSLRASLNGGPETPVDQQPDYLAAKAALDKAQYDLSNTQLRAPFSGQLGGAVPMPGKVVVSGLPVLTLAKNDSLWIQANLKETAITHVQVGDKAELEVDSYPDTSWKAVVTSISPATGSEFALIPPQNASGNWVKVVQRIPVVLHLLPGQDDKPVLRAGMSVAVKIDIETHVSDKTLHRLQQPAAGPSHQENDKPLPGRQTTQEPAQAHSPNNQPG